MISAGHGAASAALAVACHHGPQLLLARAGAVQAGRRRNVPEVGATISRHSGV